MDNINFDGSRFSLTLDAKVENVATVMGFVDQLLETAGSAVKAKLQIDVAIDEIFSNIAYYAYSSGTGKATVDFELEDGVAILRFHDRGVPYDPLQKPDPDVTLTAEERGIGGLGIFLVKKTMDDMTYEFKDGSNILTLKKRVLPETG